MNIILFDGKYRGNLLPLTFTRPVAEIRVGILTIREKWEKYFPDATISYLTEDYLKTKYPLHSAEDSIFIAGNIIPDKILIEEIKTLQYGECLFKENDLFALRGKKEDFSAIENLRNKETKSASIQICWLYDIFLRNEIALSEDYELLTRNRTSSPLPSSVKVIGNPLLKNDLPAVFLEEGAVIEETILNVKKGPVYIGKNSEIMEGSLIRGPFAICENGTVNMGAKIYGATTIGPYCKVGGELNNVVMQGFSNKAHDGFLGNAVIGEWCNLGAGTTASNLKNDYSEIKMWNYKEERFLKTGLQFCGLIMGDHSKIGINSMMNTATVMGVGVNFVGSGFPKTFIPSFAKGGVTGFSLHDLPQFFMMAEAVMKRRGKELTETDKEIYKEIFDITGKYWRVRM
ncbi:MAG: glucose-1-phosphate thymidylyltransferase [Candidatus Azobacteroides sp.]|nr:glucose-1-phosphate thymidylyltransferase [Candidatus Azobacteroides sp.]